MKTLLYLFTCICVYAAAPAAAREGLYLGVFGLYTSLSHVNHGSADYLYFNSLDSGAGIGFRAGYGFTSHVALEWSLSTTWHTTSQKTVTGASIQDQLLSAAQLNIKYCFPLTDSQFEPYLSGGIGSYWLGEGIDPGSAFYKGQGIQAGFGMEYHTRESVSLSAGLSGKSIVFDSGSWIGTSNVRGTAVTADLGFTYHF